MVHEKSARHGLLCIATSYFFLLWAWTVIASLQSRRNRRLLFIFQIFTIFCILLCRSLVMKDECHNWKISIQCHFIQLKKSLGMRALCQQNISLGKDVLHSLNLTYSSLLCMIIYWEISICSGLNQHVSFIFLFSSIFLCLSESIKNTKIFSKGIRFLLKLFKCFRYTA